MARRTKRAGKYIDVSHNEIFIESVADLATLPQVPTKDFSLGSIAWDKKFNIWVLTSNGWEASL